jgi:drug/metabolite transporter, DME family
MSSTLGAGLVLGAACLWATFGLFAKSLYAHGYTALELASIRAAIGFIGAAAVGIMRGPRRLAIPRSGMLFFAVFGIVGFALFEFIYFAVMNLTTVAVAVALLYTAPAFVLIFSRMVWHERVPVWKWLALLLVLAGVVLVTGAADAGLVSISVTVLMLGLLSGVAYAGYTIMSKYSSRHYDPVQSLFWSFGFATLAFAVVAPPFEPAFRDPSMLPMLLALGIVPTLLPYALFLTGMRALRASTASMLASVEPMVAAVLAAIVLHEQLTPLRVLGVALIVGAAALLGVEVSSGSDPEPESSRP